VKYLKKNDYVTCHGRLETRKYRDKDNIERTAVQMRVDRIDYGPRAPVNQNQDVERELSNFNPPANTPADYDPIFGGNNSDMNDIPF
jgi:single-stranded DNA-binding protein